MEHGARPTRAIRIKDYRDQRRTLLILSSLAVGAFGFQGLSYLWLWSLRGWDFPPPFALSLMLSAPFLFVAFFSLFLVESFRLCDLEVSPEAVRLPFRRHPLRHGWRSWNELVLLSAHADRDRRDEAVKAVNRLRGPLRRFVGRARIHEWMRSGGLLVVTKDEVLWHDAPLFLLGFIEGGWHEFKAKRRARYAAWA